MIKLMRLLALAAASAALAAAAPPARPPVKGWVVDYGDSACTALRTYGTEASPVTLAFRPSPNGNVVRLVLARPGRGPEAAEQFWVTVKLGSATARTSGLRFGAGTPRQEFAWINVKRADLEGLRSSSEIAIEGSPVDERFALPDIGRALDALDACNADLRAYWNVGEHSGKAATPAAPLKPLMHYFSSDDYPAQAAAQQHGGVSVIVMMVDEKGALKDCLVEQTSGIATLDAMTCLVIRERAKFRPAADSAGRPVRSVLTQRVVWKISEAAGR